MKLSKTTEYALRTMIFLAREDGINNARKISAACDIPLKYFQKISHLLATKDLLDIHRGKNGGFALSKSASEISVYDIITASQEPENNAESCRLFGGDCHFVELKDACTLRQALIKVEAIEQELFSSLSLEAIANAEHHCCTLEELLAGRAYQQVSKAV